MIFYRRFLTPLGIIGSQQIIYLISENSLSSITLESEIADSSFSHKMILNRSTLYAKDLLPANFSLTQNYPNPFNPSTTIIVHMQDNTNATLDIVNLNGKSIRTLFVGNINIGISKFKWDGSDETGKPMASGTYFYRLKTKSSTDTKKMVLLR
mgnify:FL=1